jgi:hypothetical protein
MLAACNKETGNMTIRAAVLCGLLILNANVPAVAQMTDDDREFLGEAARCESIESSGGHCMPARRTKGEADLSSETAPARPTAPGLRGAGVKLSRDQVVERCRAQRNPAKFCKDLIRAQDAVRADQTERRRIDEQIRDTPRLFDWSKRMIQWQDGTTYFGRKNRPSDPKVSQFRPTSRKPGCAERVYARK